MEEREVIFKGRVQGVGFRAMTVRLATELGLKGKVANRSDGSVLMNVQGDSSHIDQLIQRLEQSFTITNVQQVEKSIQSSYRNFTID